MPRWLLLFLWIPDTPVVPPSVWTMDTTGVPRMTAGGASLPGLFRAIQGSERHLKQERRVILLLMFSGNVKVVAFVPLDSRHPSRPAFGGQWTTGVPRMTAGGASLPGLFWAIQGSERHLKQERRVILLLMFSGNVKVVAFVPLDSRHPSRPAEGGTTGAGGIQWLLQVAPTVVSPQLVLLSAPVRIKEGGESP